MARTSGSASEPGHASTSRYPKTSCQMLWAQPSERSATAVLGPGVSSCSICTTLPLSMINDGTPAGAINHFQPGCRVERSLLRYLAGNGFCGTPAAP
jgi:hypothetical protein